jgi:hypothetical protein
MAVTLIVIRHAILPTREVISNCGVSSKCLASSSRKAVFPAATAAASAGRAGVHTRQHPCHFILLGFGRMLRQAPGIGSMTWAARDCSQDPGESGNTGGNE